MKRAVWPVTVCLEPMQVADLDDVLLIEHRAFTTPWSLSLFRSELKHEASHLFVARPDDLPDTVAGYVGYRVVVDEMHIVIVAVDPVRRRQGIATQMIDQAMTHARDNSGCRRATLEVRVSNIEAQKLYFRHNFAPVGTRPGYYMRPKEDALILWRDPL